MSYNSSFTQDPTVPHDHQCGQTSFGMLDIGCGHRWTHTTFSGLPPGVRAEVHMCPKCGMGPWYYILEDLVSNKLTEAEIERLTLVAEEAAEVVQAVTKILRHGWMSTHPDHPDINNREHLVKELGDLRGAATLLVQAKEIHIWEYQKFALEKIQRMRRYLHCQENDELAIAVLDIHTGHG